MKNYLQQSARLPHFHAPKSSGFTLLEALVVMAMIGIVAALVAPAFLGFRERQKVTIGQQMVYQAIRATQADAMQRKEQRQFSIRQTDNRLEWSSHARSISPLQVPHWEPLPEGIVLSDKDNTFAQASGVYYVRFSFQGDVQFRLGTLTLTGANGGNVERCVIVSTLIGAMRKGEGHTKPNGNGRYCY